MADIMYCGILAVPNCGPCGTSSNYFYTCKGNVEINDSNNFLTCDKCQSVKNLVCVDCFKNTLIDVNKTNPSTGGPNTEGANTENTNTENTNTDSTNTDNTNTNNDGTKTDNVSTISTSIASPTQTANKAGNDTEANNSKGSTPASSQNNDSSGNQLMDKTGLSNGTIYGIGAAIVIIIVIIAYIVMKRMKKPKDSNNNNKFGGERNYNATQGYDQLNDDNYSSYRTLSNPNLHKPVDSNPFAQVPNVDELPNYDSILIDDPNAKAKGNNNNSVNSNNILFNNLKDTNSQTSLLMKSSNVGSTDSFTKSSNSHMYEGSDIYSNKNRPMSSDLQYGSPQNHSQTNIDVMAMSATVTTTDAMNINKNGIMSPKYNGSRQPQMQYNNFNENNASGVNATNNVYNETDSKQAYSNMPYSPSAQNNRYYQGVKSPSMAQKMNSPNGSKLYIYTNQNQNQNQPQSQQPQPQPQQSQPQQLQQQQLQNQIQSPHQNQIQSPHQNPLINPAVNPAVNPFSDSHATVTPTNGYPQTELNGNSSMMSNHNNSKVMESSQVMKEVNESSMNQNFANISINHSFKHNNDSFNNSPMTPKSISSFKSPSVKHQSLVTSPNHKNMNSKRATISSPTNELFMSPMALEAMNSNSIRSPSTPKTPKSTFTPNINGTPTINDSRNSIRMNSPSIMRPSTPNNHHTPNLERMPSSRSTTVSSSNSASPNLERKTSGKSQRSITTATPVMENIPSAMGKQTLERHHSGKSNYATATLERVPSAGQKQIRKHTPGLDRNGSGNKKHNRNPSSQDNNSMVGSVTGSGSVVGSNNGSDLYLNTTVENKNGGSSILKSPMSAQKSPQPQPKSILKNANVPNNTLGSSKSQEDLSNVAKSQSIKRKKSKPRNKNQADINIPPFPSMSRKASGAVKDNASNTASPYSENVPTTPLRPPQLTVFGHAVATPPTPKSTRFPQDAKVLPPTERATPVPPDILGGTDVIPLNTMTLQRKHFHKRNKSVSANVAKEYELETSTEDSSTAKAKSFGEHPLPVPPPHRYPSNKSTDDLTSPNKSLENERVGRGQEPSEGNHYRSKSLPRPNKYGNGASRYAEENAQYNSSLPNNAFIYNLEQKCTSFEVEFYKENENQKATKSRSKNSVISILHEEKRNMDYYIAHCND